MNTKIRRSTKQRYSHKILIKSRLVHLGKLRDRMWFSKTNRIQDIHVQEFAETNTTIFLFYIADLEIFCLTIRNHQIIMFLRYINQKPKKQN